MGKYVNVIGGEVIGASFRDKVQALIGGGAKETTGDKFEENLVCVVDNGFFAAAGYAYNESEYEEFSDPDDPRPKRWFTLDDVENIAK